MFTDSHEIDALPALFKVNHDELEGERLVAEGESLGQRARALFSEAGRVSRKAEVTTRAGETLKSQANGHIEFISRILNEQKHE